MAIDAKKMTFGTTRPGIGVGTAAAAAAASCCTGARRRLQQYRHRQLTSGMLLSTLLPILRGDIAAAPPPSLAFVAGGPLHSGGAATCWPGSARCGAIRRRVGFAYRYGYDIDDRKSRTEEGTVGFGGCLMATPGGDTEEEKMELAAEVPAVCMCFVSLLRFGALRCSCRSLRTRTHTYRYEYSATAAAPAVENIPQSYHMSNEYS